MRLRVGQWSALDTCCWVMEVKGPLPRASFSRTPTCGLLQVSMECPYPGGPFLTPQGTVGHCWDSCLLMGLGGQRRPNEERTGAQSFGHTVALVLNLFPPGWGCGIGSGHPEAVDPQLYS